MIGFYRVLHLAVLVALMAWEVGAQAPIPKRCKVSGWGEWSDCIPFNGKCGLGNLTRSRSVTQAPNLTGGLCPELTQYKSCQKNCFSFVLNAATGKEEVMVKVDKKAKLYVLKKGKNEFQVETWPKVFVAFTNAKYTSKNKPSGTSNAITFSWGENAFLGEGFAGRDPEYVSSIGGFKCGSEGEHGMCQAVRNGKFKWTGMYRFNFPETTDPPTQSPTDSPTPSPTPSPSATPTPAPTPSPTPNYALGQDITLQAITNWRHLSEGMSYDAESGIMRKESGGNWASGAAGYDITREQTILWKGDRNAHVMVGLTSGDVKNDHYNTIDCAMWMDKGYLRTSERMFHRSNNRAYRASDVLGISINNDGLVQFIKNGEPFRDCNLSLEFPVHLDMSFHDSGDNKAQVQFLGVKTNAVRWQMITSGMEWTPNTGRMYMTGGGNGLQGAASENLYEASILHFKAPVSSNDMVGFTAGAVRDFEADRTSNGTPLMPCMMKMGGGKANPILRLYENGKSQGSDGPEDMLRVFEIASMNFAEDDIIGLGISSSGVVSFYKNEIKFRECGQILEFPVHIDAVFNTRSHLTFLSLEHYSGENPYVVSTDSLTADSTWDVESGVVQSEEPAQSEPLQATSGNLEETTTGVASVETPPESEASVQPVSSTSTGSIQKKIRNKLKSDITKNMLQALLNEAKEESKDE